MFTLRLSCLCWRNNYSNGRPLNWAQSRRVHLTGGRKKKNGNRLSRLLCIVRCVYAVLISFGWMFLEDVRYIQCIHGTTEFNRSKKTTTTTKPIHYLTFSLIHQQPSKHLRIVFSFSFNRTKLLTPRIIMPYD